MTPGVNMATLATYSPQGVRIPDNVDVERTFDGDPGKETLPDFDRRTVFCDIFLSHRRDQLLCIGPPLLNLGKPELVMLRGATRRFAVENPPIPEPRWRMSLLRIALEAGDERAMETGTVELHVRFAEFRLDIAVARPAADPRNRVSLTLCTLQKDNDPQWLQDWCTWHHRAHGVERVVFYDNGSRDADEVYAKLAQRSQGFELMVIHWNYLYGPAEAIQLYYAQTMALNHFRLLFGPQTRWCINLDVDEYLYSNGRRALASVLDCIAGAAIHLPSYIVPAVAHESGGRCFDSPWRLRNLESGKGRKYIYRPEAIRFNDIHDFVPKSIGYRAKIRLLTVLGTLGWEKIIRGIVMAKRTLRKAKARLSGIGNVAGEPILFFYHFRTLNTGWKVPRTFVHADPEKHVHDKRLGAMRHVVEYGIQRKAILVTPANCVITNQSGPDS